MVPDTAVHPRGSGSYPSAPARVLVFCYFTHGSVCVPTEMTVINKKSLSVYISAGPLFFFLSVHSLFINQCYSPSGQSIRLRAKLKRRKRHRHSQERPFLFQCPSSFTPCWCWVDLLEAYNSSVLFFLQIDGEAFIVFFSLLIEFYIICPSSNFVFSPSSFHFVFSRLSPCGECFDPIGDILILVPLSCESIAAEMR